MATRTSFSRFSFTRFLRRNPLAAIGLLLLATWIFVSIAAPAIAPIDPKKQNVSKRLTPPGDLYTFGSDQLGRDVLTRVMYAGRTSLPGGVIVVICATLIGTTVGAIAGFAGGWVDELIMRLTEVFLAFPTIILAMTIAAALGPFDLKNQLSSNRTQGVPNMIALIRETAARYAAD